MSEDVKLYIYVCNVLYSLNNSRRNTIFIYLSFHSIHFCYGFLESGDTPSRFEQRNDIENRYVWSMKSCFVILKPYRIESSDDVHIYSTEYTDRRSLFYQTRSSTNSKI